MSIASETPRATSAAQRAAGLALDIAGVSKVFRRGGQLTQALRSIDLSVAAGEFVSLLGPSGCGKSTLLHIAAGFIRQDAGEVRAHGAPVEGPNADRGVLFQSPTLFPWLSSRDNVLFGPRASGRMGEEAASRADELPAMVGLADFRDHYPHQLSGGMRHRGRSRAPGSTGRVSS